MANTTISIKKLNQWAKRDYAAVENSIEAYIEPLDDSLRMLYDDSPGGNMYRIFCDSLWVKIWDLITSTTHGDLKVLWIKPYSSPIESHIEITVRDHYD